MTGKKKGPAQNLADPPITMVYPHLHQRVVDAILPHDLYPGSEPPVDGIVPAVKNSYSTFVVGTFSCLNCGCHKSGWGSGKVTIVIKGYYNNSYRAIVYGQRFKLCNTLGIMTLDEETYVDRVARRVKRWGGI
ncbi:hypothetical protein B0H67DRAFT_495188 [Lasiosphaeris hirsuta]|uniref:3CxxC-type domain-containing protein n=1 Tax=Lasiosphaeris hirsuta TaxID=260670 RepID=A0AA40A3F6_9PEZI|nr:hypothetical protein B0H67DRAFT_495188 [Lasiosphaeris hirsuta]